MGRRGRLNEYVLLTDSANEADNNELQQPDAQNGGNGTDGGMQQQPQQQTPPQGAGGMGPNGGGMPGPDGMPQDMGAPMGGGQPMGQDPNGAMPPAQDAPMDVTQGMDLPDAQMGQDGIEDVEMNDDPNAPGPDDEVIDVDDLTQSQQAAEYKIDGVDDKLTTLGAVVKKFIEALKQNDAKIDDLKAEFERRNPTAEERLNLRSVSSVPYMETPREYWDNKVSGDPRYSVMHDNTISPKDEQQAFELRKGDVKGRDDREVADSFDYPMELKDILDW